MLPAQTIQLVEAGRPMAMLPALHEAATSIAVFGNRTGYWTLYVGDLNTRTLYFQDNLGDRAERTMPHQAQMLSDWLSINVSNGEGWNVRLTPATLQADNRSDGAMGNDCGLDAIYGLKYYIQHGARVHVFEWRTSLANNAN